MENKIRHMELIGVDYWSRPVYKCQENGNIWKDINCGMNENNIELCSCDNEFDGEPDSPIRKDLKIVFIK